MLRFRPLPWLTVFSVVSLSLLVALGTWQLHRLEWKTALLDDLADRADAEPLSLAAGVAAAREGRDLRFRPLADQGALGSRVAYIPATLNGRPGWRAFALFEAADGGLQAALDLGVRVGSPGEPPDYAPPGETQDIRALIAPAPRSNLFTPPAETERGVFYVRDIEALGAYFGADPARLAPFTLALTRPIAEARDAPAPAPPTLATISNRHLEYAMTWYGLGLALIAVYVAFHLRAGRLSLAVRGD